MSKVVESYKNGQGDLYVDGCEDCQLMLRSGYGRAGCTYHKLAEERDRYRVALEEIVDSQEPWEPQRTIAIKALGN